MTPPDQITALNEMYRALKADGLTFIEMGNGERKKYRQIINSSGYGHENRVWNSQFKERTPPNVIYIHDRHSLLGIAEKPEFEKYRVKFQNINHKIRTVAYLFKGPGSAAGSAAQPLSNSL